MLVTRRFAAGWASQSDSYLGNRSWVGSALGAHRWGYLMSWVLLRVTNALGSGASASRDRRIGTAKLADPLLAVRERPYLPILCVLSLVWGGLEMRSVQRLTDSREHRALVSRGAR